MKCNFKSLEEQTKEFRKTLKVINNTLKECLKNGTALNSDETKTLENVIENLTEDWRNFREELTTLLELIEKISNETSKKFLNKLREKLLVRNLEEWLKNIEDIDYSIVQKFQKSESFQKTYNQNKFKILENTRLGNFDQVIYILERFFFAAESQMLPIELIEILANPSISSEIKKSAVYLFLASLENKLKQNQEG